MHKELRKTFGDSHERPTIQQLDKLQYLGRVIKEVLRLYPSVPTISRAVHSDLVIGNKS